MTSTRKVGRGVLKFGTCLQILLILNNRSIVQFYRRGAQNWLEFMALNVLLLKFQFGKAFKIESSFRKALIFFLYKQSPPQAFPVIISKLSRSYIFKKTSELLLNIFCSLKFVKHVSCVNIF